MKKEIKGATTNDLANAFIWSAFKYYLRQDTDSYIVFSPIKYWKSQHLINKKFINGFGFNRKHFHTNTNAFISCILWQNSKYNLKEFILETYDIENENLVKNNNITIKRVYTLFSEKFYNQELDQNDKFDGISSELNGLENQKHSRNRVKKIYNENIIGYLVSTRGFDNARLNCGLTICGRYDGNGTFLRKDNFLEKLPIFTAGKYTDNYNHWTIMSQVMKSADKYDDYIKDVRNGKLNSWLLKNLLYTSLTHYSHMRSLNGSDGRFYRNELCLDTSNGETLASTTLKQINFNNDELNLIKVWKQVLDEAKKTNEYNPDFTYGLYQIDEELNTKFKDEKGRNIYNYPELNGHIKTLKTLLKSYYLKEIVPTLFEYELLK